MDDPTEAGGAEQAVAAAAEGPVRIGALPVPLYWQAPPRGWRVSGDGTLTVTAGPRTDLFVDPRSGQRTLTAPRLLASLPGGDFQLSARVQAELAATFDAGVLVLYRDDTTWAKLCLERSPQGRPMVVSVVTRGVSDDCNSFAVDRDHVWLRVARIDRAYAFHASADGTAWNLVRYFALTAGAAGGGGGAGDSERGEVAVGFLAQSPAGEGCVVRFDQVTYVAERLRDLRSGE